MWLLPNCGCWYEPSARHTIRLGSTVSSRPAMSERRIRRESNGGGGGNRTPVRKPRTTSHQMIRSDKALTNQDSLRTHRAVSATVCHLKLAHFRNVFSGREFTVREYERESMWTNGSEEVSRREAKRVFLARVGRRPKNSRGPEVERKGDGYPRSSSGVCRLISESPMEGGG